MNTLAKLLNLRVFAFAMSSLAEFVGSVEYEGKGDNCAAEIIAILQRNDITVSCVVVLSAGYSMVVLQSLKHLGRSLSRK